jgi:hypothetical protein
VPGRNGPPIFGDGMINALSSMEYPHWLIVAGAILLMLGFAGLISSKRGAEAYLNDMALNDMANDQEPSEPEGEFAPTQDANRTSKPEEP